MKCLTQFKLSSSNSRQKTFSQLTGSMWMYPNTHSDTVSLEKKKKRSEVWFILFLINNTHDGDLKMHHNETLSLVQHSAENCPREQSCCSTMPQEIELLFMAYNSLVHYSIFILLSYKQKKFALVQLQSIPTQSSENILKY